MEAIYYNEKTRTYCNIKYSDNFVFVNCLEQTRKFFNKERLQIHCNNHNYQLLWIDERPIGQRPINTSSTVYNMKIKLEIPEQGQISNS